MMCRTITRGVLATGIASALLALGPGGCSRPVETGRHTPRAVNVPAREVAILLEDLRNGHGLTAEETAAMEPALLGYRISGGDLDEITPLVDYAAHQGCRGACLTETAVSMNRARERGVHSAQARELVATALASERMVPHPPAGRVSAGDLAQRVQARVDVMLHRQETLHRAKVDALLTDLRGRVGLTHPETRQIEAPVLGYLVGGGDMDQIRLALSSAASGGCRGDCLEEVASCMNVAVERGIPCLEARTVLTRAVREELDLQSDRESKLTPGELGARVREHLEQYLAERP